MRLPSELTLKDFILFFMLPLSAVYVFSDFGFNSEIKSFLSNLAYFFYENFHTHLIWIFLSLSVLSFCFSIHISYLLGKFQIFLRNDFFVTKDFIRTDQFLDEISIYSKFCSKVNLTVVIVFISGAVFSIAGGFLSGNVSFENLSYLFVLALAPLFMSYALNEDTAKTLKEVLSDNLLLAHRWDEKLFNEVQACLQGGSVMAVNGHCHQWLTKQVHAYIADKK